MPASWSTSVTSLVKTIVGAGILGLPFAFAQTGVALGVALLVLSGAAQLFALQLLSALVVDAKEHSTPSYRSLALAAFGSDVGASAVEAINGVHCFGTATAYLIVVGDLCPQLAALCISPDGGLALLLERRIWIAFVGVGVELPLFWQRTLEALNVTSTIGNAAVTAVGVLTAAFAVGALQTSPPQSVPVSLLPPPEDVAPVATKIGVLGVFVFAYAWCARKPRAPSH